MCIHVHVVNNKIRCVLCKQTVFTMSSEHPVDAKLAVLAARGSTWYLILLAVAIVVSGALQVQPHAIYTT